MLDTEKCPLDKGSSYHLHLSEERKFLPWNQQASNGNITSRAAPIPGHQPRALSSRMPCRIASAMTTEWFSLFCFKIEVKGPQILRLFLIKFTIQCCHWSKQESLWERDYGLMLLRESPMQDAQGLRSALRSARFLSPEAALRLFPWTSTYFRSQLLLITSLTEKK